MTTAAVIVAGAGHNALVAAAYLARAGLEVLVLEARDEPGGGTATEELIPGFRIDTASTGHNGILANPLLRDDELELRSRYGLEYVLPDPANRLVLPDGEVVTTWLDVDRTVAELARLDRQDAATYRRMLGDWDRVKRIFGAAQASPVGWGTPLDEALAAEPGGNVWRRRRALSAWDVVHHEYRDPRVRAYVLWAVAQSLTSIDLPGSGLQAVAAPAGRQVRSWPIPIGGSAALPRALVRAIEDHGGTVRCGARVVRLLVDGDRCTGVETADGGRYHARRAVVSTIHVKHLLDMAPRSTWPEDFVYGVETLDVGLSIFVLHLATDRPPLLRGAEDEVPAVASGIAGTPEAMLDAVRAVRDGRRPSTLPSILIGTPSLVDPSRAPAGQHTTKFVLAAPARGPEPGVSWDEGREAFADRVLAAVREHVPNLKDEAILGRVALSPSDLARWNPHMIDGTAHGGDRGLPFSGALRPAPGWAQHRLPFVGLYQTGGTTHPGGSVTGLPGRNAAMVVLRDLGRELDDVVAR
ncbi:MAG: phytoene desaturase family protein [Nitriliruptoraceae bacterium]